MTLWRSRERVSSRSTRRTPANDATALFSNVTALSQTDLNPSASPTRPAEIVEGGAGTVPDENVDHAGSAVIYGRSDSTLNRGGVRMGTSEFYRVVEAFPEVVDSLVIDTSGATNPAGELLCFVVLAPDVRLDEIEPKLRQALRAELSPRHVPDQFIAIDEVPRTLNGKMCEVPVKKILTGTTPEQAVSQDALRNPDALKPFLGLGAS
jgi:hypothetical protein